MLSTSPEGSAGAGGAPQPLAAVAVAATKAAAHKNTFTRSLQRVSMMESSGFGLRFGFKLRLSRSLLGIARFSFQPELANDARGCYIPPSRAPGSLGRISLD